MHAESEIREPLILGTKTYRQITDDIIAPIEGKASKGWYVLLTIFAMLANVLNGAGRAKISMIIATIGARPHQPDLTPPRRYHPRV